jgi:uncharacterized protein (DUF362 family)
MAAMRSPRSAMALSETPPKSTTSRVALTTGDNRTNNIFQGLKVFEKEIRDAIGNRRVIVKPNNVSTTIQLAASHVDSLEGILEFLKSIGKTNVVIAESAAEGPTTEGFENFNYYSLGKKYAVDLIDLDKQDYELVYVVSDEDFHPHAARMSRLLLDPDNFIISSAMLKTHDRVVATLSLKNIVFGAPIKDEGFRWGPRGRKGARNDKPITHGGGVRGVNYNLFALAPRLHPDLAVIDGFQGMEGNGPTGGSPVDHRVAVVSMDWLAADRVGVELMGIDFSKIGYLNYCAQAGLGQADLEKIEVVGEKIADHVKPYRLHDRAEQQLIWMKPMQRG